MFPGGKNIKDLMKQAQKMQQQVENAQKELESKIFTVSSGGGIVTVEMNGKNELKSLKIDPQAVDPEDVEMLEDLIVAAIQEAHAKVSAASEEIMGKVTGGMNIPGLF